MFLRFGFRSKSGQIKGRVVSNCTQLSLQSPYNDRNVIASRSQSRIGHQWCNIKWFHFSVKANMDETDRQTEAETETERQRQTDRDKQKETGIRETETDRQRRKEIQSCLWCSCVKRPTTIQLATKEHTDVYSHRQVIKVLHLGQRDAVVSSQCHLHQFTSGLTLSLLASL